MKAFAAFLVLSLAIYAADAPPATFYRDVLPILQDHCQSCHRAGEIGPMPLGSYSEVRPWAKAIRQAVLSRKMPPWFGEDGVGSFHNNPSLAKADIDKFAAWADSGAPEGNPKDAPQRRTFVDGWNIGTPDQIVEMPQPYQVPASGTIEYTYVIVPTGFKKDRWVIGAEFRPGNRAVMHHAQVFVRQAGDRWLRDYPSGVAFVPKEQIRTPDLSRPALSTNAGAGPLTQSVAGYVPGRPERLLPGGYAMLIPAGSDLVFQLHYTANGKAAADQSRVGFIFAKTPPKKRLMRVTAIDDGFTIPPGAANFAVSGSMRLGTDCELIALYPHMHLRGKSMTLSADYPSGEHEELLSVPHYNFNWQLLYEMSEPKQLPKGTVLHADAIFDNSANNPFNPDPKIEVHWGDQSWEEMMVGFFSIAIPVNADPRSVYARR